MRNCKKGDYIGYAKIIYIYEDGIKGAMYSKEQWERLKPEVGEATLQVCIGGSRGVKSARVLGHSNCVNYCDEAHSTDSKLYLWTGNCLRPVYRLDDEDFAIVEQLITEENKRRDNL